VSLDGPTGGPAPPLRELPATFRWLLGGMFVSALCTFVFPFLALYLRQRGFSIAQAGLVTGLFGAGSILSGPLAGWAADRLGRRPTILASLLATALLTALLGAVQADWALVLLAALLGLVMSAYRPAAKAVVADVLPPAQRARGYGLIHWANNIGVAISFAVGGPLASRGFSWLFLADAATTLCFAGLVAWRVPETRPQRHVTSAGAPPRGYGTVLADGHLLALLGLLLLLLLPFCQFMAAVPLAMTAAGHDTAAYGRVMALNGVLIGLFQPALSRVAGRHDPGRVLALSALLVGLGNGGYALAGTGSAWGWAGATAIWTFGEILLFPAMGALVAALSPEDLRGRYQGLFSVTFGLGLAAAPPLGALVLERLGSTALWLGCLAVALAVAAGQLAVAPARRRALSRRARG